MRSWIVALGALLAGAAPVGAQTEAALRDAFEGQMVTVKLDMPGTEDGIDVYPGGDRPIDYPKVARRLKQNGTAIRAGQSIMVTKVKVKSKHIEFQLAGGGYGTFGDDAGTSASVGSTSKSKREEALEKAIKSEADPARKRAMQDELDDLRKARQREDRRNEASLAVAEEAKKANVRQRRLEGGSRFNVRFENSIPATALTPDGVRAALARFVDFPSQAVPAGSTALTNQDHPAPSSASAGKDLRKGLLVHDVEAMYGPASRAEERSEGTLKVSVRTYHQDQRRITAEFVEGVLVRYTIGSD
jgi:hypothetical protein